MKKVILVFLMILVSGCFGGNVGDSANKKPSGNDSDNKDILLEILLFNQKQGNIFCEEFDNPKIMYFDYNLVILEDGTVYQIAEPGLKFSNGSTCQKQELSTKIKKRLSHRLDRFLGEDKNVYYIEINENEGPKLIRESEYNSMYRHIAIDLFEKRGVDEIFNFSYPTNIQPGPLPVDVVVLKNNSIYEYTYTDYPTKNPKYRRNKLRYNKKNYEGEIINYFWKRVPFSSAWPSETMEYLITDKAFYKTGKIVEKDCDVNQNIECEYALKKQGNISVDNYKYISEKFIVDSEYNYYDFPY